LGLRPILNNKKLIIKEKITNFQFNNIRLPQLPQIKMPQMNENYKVDSKKLRTFYEELQSSLDERNAI
jgi:hypothetical protein